MTNENFIKTLIENQDFSKKLTELYNEVYSEQIKMKRNRNQTANFYSGFNKARDKMIKYLFNENKTYHFMDFVPIEKYNYLVDEIGLYVNGLKFANEFSKIISHHDQFKY